MITTTFLWSFMIGFVGANLIVSRIRDGKFTDEVVMMNIYVVIFTTSIYIISLL